jgi:hypothetical protein
MPLRFLVSLPAFTGAIQVEDLNEYLLTLKAPRDVG